MLETFVKEYEKQLTIAVQDHPKMYGYGVDRVPAVVKAMTAAFKGDRAFSKDGPAMLATCKKLGIKYTYTAIKEYLRG